MNDYRGHHKVAYMDTITCHGLRTCQGMDLVSCPIPSTGGVRQFYRVLMVKSFSHLGGLHLA